LIEENTGCLQKLGKKRGEKKGKRLYFSYTRAKEIWIRRWVERVEGIPHAKKQSRGCETEEDKEGKSTIRPFLRVLFVANITGAQGLKVEGLTKKVCTTDIQDKGVCSMWQSTD